MPFNVLTNTVGSSYQWDSHRGFSHLWMENSIFVLATADSQPQKGHTVFHPQLAEPTDAKSNRGITSYTGFSIAEGMASLTLCCASVTWTTDGDAPGALREGRGRNRCCGRMCHEAALGTDAAMNTRNLARGACTSVSGQRPSPSFPSIFTAKDSIGRT